MYVLASGNEHSGKMLNFIYIIPVNITVGPQLISHVKNDKQ